MSEEQEYKKSDSENSDKDDDSKGSKDSESDDKSQDSKNSEIEEVHENFDSKSVKSNESIENDDDYIFLKEELDKANNLVDYFLILGLEPNIFLNDWLYENDLDKLNELYKDKLQPKIISSFPCFEKHTIAFDDSILSHCFPDGFELVSSIYRPQPKLFSFILDNNYFNLNYPQKYLTCFLFYENIAGYRLLYEQNKILSAKDEDPTSYNFVPEISTFIQDLKNRNIYIPKCLLIMSLHPFFGEFEKILIEIYNYSINLVNEVDKKEDEDEKKDDKKKQKGSIAKRKRKRVYQELYMPIDKIVENICIEIPEPPRGVSSLIYTLNKEKRTIKQNLMNQLPLVNINLKRLFVDFEVKDIISMYNYLFLETRILFFSRNIEILNIYIFGLLSFLYPFQYQYQIVTILPEQNFEIMESITPFIAGINQTFEDDFFEKRGFTLSDLIVVVDIDNNRLVLINSSEETQVPKFPSGNRKALKNNLQKYINDNLGDALKQLKKKKIEMEKDSKKLRDTFTFNHENINIDELNENYQAQRSKSKKVTVSTKELDIYGDFDIAEMLDNFNIDYKFNKDVHHIFFNFNAVLLANYSKFLNLDFYSSNIMPCLEILFKVEEYLNEIPPQDKDFYNKFISETQIFGDFLYLRMIPKNSNEKIRILLFDEKINENSTGIFSKPPPMIFTNCTDYEFKEKREVNAPRKVSEFDASYYKEIKNRKKLLEYGIIITTEDEKIKFKYPIFPKLTTKIFFQNMLDYSSPMNWNETIDNINADIISKSHLGGITLRQNDMSNYVYLCWMQMWAITFWYCEHKEQKYRFQDLLRVLDISHCYDMEIFNLLFEAITLYGQENKNYMILKLYDLILSQHLNPSLKIHSIVVKIMEKENIEGNEQIKSLISNEIDKKYTKANFKKRAFRAKFNQHILSEDIELYAFDNCTKCQNEINLETLSKDYKNMGREVLWAKCPRCNDYILPKLTIKLGKEINKSGYMRINTCTYESVVLYSPFTLKNNYKSSVLKNYNVKLDVNEYMKNYKEIFWDSLWYFKMNNLEYDFMLPYENSAHDILIPNKNLAITISGSTA